MTSENAELSSFLETLRECGTVGFGCASGQEEDLLIGLDAEGLESDGNGNVLCYGIVTEVDFAFLRHDVSLGLEAAMS